MPCPHSTADVGRVVYITNSLEFCNAQLFCRPRYQSKSHRIKPIKCKIIHAVERARWGKQGKSSFSSSLYMLLMQKVLQTKAMPLWRWNKRREGGRAQHWQFAFSPIKAQTTRVQPKPSTGNLIENFPLFDGETFASNLFVIPRQKTFWLWE